MLYIFNKTISNSKSILYALTNLYGINKYQSQKICENVGINPKTTLSKLQSDTINRLTNYINKHYVNIEEFLRKNKKDRNNELLEIKTIRGIRQNSGLPVRGQRTHTNAKTSKRLKNIFILKKKKKNKKKINLKIHQQKMNLKRKKN